MDYLFTLTKEARSNGGDRYETKLENESKPWVIYIPQSITRIKGSTRSAFIVSFDIPGGDRLYQRTSTGGENND